MNSPTNNQLGFTAVELLVTIFVAAIFLAAGYQLFSTILRGGTEGRDRADASLVGSKYLNEYQDDVVDPCVASTPLANVAITEASLTRPTVTVDITCPVASAPSLSKIEATVNYGDTANRYTVKRTLYVEK